MHFRAHASKFATLRHVFCRHVWNVEKGGEQRVGTLKALGQTRGTSKRVGPVISPPTFSLLNRQKFIPVKIDNPLVQADFVLTWRASANPPGRRRIPKTIKRHRHISRQETRYLSYAHCGVKKTETRVAAQTNHPPTGVRRT